MTSKKKDDMEALLYSEEQIRTALGLVGISSHFVSKTVDLLKVLNNFKGCERAVLVMDLKESELGQYIVLPILGLAGVLTDVYEGPHDYYLVIDGKIKTVKYKDVVILNTKGGV